MSLTIDLLFSILINLIITANDLSSLTIAIITYVYLSLLSLP